MGPLARLIQIWEYTKVETADPDALPALKAPGNIPAKPKGRPSNAFKILSGIPVSPGFHVSRRDRKALNRTENRGGRREGSGRKRGKRRAQVWINVPLELAVKLNKMPAPQRNQYIGKALELLEMMQPLATVPLANPRHRERMSVLEKARDDLRRWREGQKPVVPRPNAKGKPKPRKKVRITMAMMREVVAEARELRQD